MAVGNLTDTLQFYCGSLIQNVEYLRQQRAALLKTKGTDDWNPTSTYSLRGIDAALDDLYRQIGHFMSDLNEHYTSQQPAAPAPTEG